MRGLLSFPSDSCDNKTQKSRHRPNDSQGLRRDSLFARRLRGRREILRILVEFK